MHRALTLGLLIALSATACKESDRRPDSPQDLTPPALQAATQQDLVRELDAADAHGTWAELKHRWQGQVLRWNVTRYRSLCRTAGACNVAVFPIQRPAKQGWLPELVFAPGQFAALEAACGDREHCDIAIEGILDRLDASAEMPTNLRFSNVRVLTKTAAR